MTRALGLAGATIGDRCESPEGAPRLTGIVEHGRQEDRSRSMVIRLTRPTEGIALIGSYPGDEGGRGAISIYFYGGNAEQNANAARDEWSSWLRDLLAPAAAA